MLGPSPSEAIDRILADFRSELHNCFPARVVRYNAAKQTVDVKPCITRPIPGEEWEEDIHDEIPELPNVPIQWYRAGGFVITLPLKAGDYVTVHCADQSTLVWREKGGVGALPGINDEFGLNGCWAEPGNYPDNREHTLSNVSTEDFEIRHDQAGVVISIKPDGSVRIKSGDVTIGNGPAPQAVALADLVKSEINKAVTGHTHTAPGGATGNGTLAVPVGDVGASNLKAT